MSAGVRISKVAVTTRAPGGASTEGITVTSVRVSTDPPVNDVWFRLAATWRNLGTGQTVAAG